MLTETWTGWAIAITRKDGTEKIFKYDAFLSIHPDQAEVILRKMRRENPAGIFRVVPITVEVREISEEELAAATAEGSGL
jgi:hypothetical protein